MLLRRTTSNAVVNFTSIISPVMFNEFRVGYNRRATSNPGGKHSIKVGYEMIWTLYSDKAATLPGATKSWSFKERAKLSFRLDGHNLPWKRPNLSPPGTTYNLNNPGAFGRLTGTVGDFSNFGTAQANVQANIRVEF
jgi:hypothetical protein